MPKFKQFCDLHTHTFFSILDGVSSPTDNVKRAKELGMPGLAISDHGTVAGIYEHYRACKKEGIVPIIGNELYWRLDLNMPKASMSDEDREKDRLRKYFHGCFYAMNETGYKNLLRLSSIGFREDHYQFGRPVVSIDEILEHSEGLCYSTGCMIGLFGVAQGNPLSEEESAAILDRMHEAFKDRMVVEIGPAQVCMDWNKEEKKFDPIPDGCLQEKHNQRAIKLARERNIPLVISSDGHMARPELKPVQDQLIKSAPGNKSGWHFHQIHSMMSSGEAWDQISKYHPYVDQKTFEGCIDNTYLILDLVKDLHLKFAPIVPEFPKEKHPLYQRGMTSRDLMYKIIMTSKFLPTKNGQPDPKYINRLKQEIAVICDNGTTDYTDYFLILSDIVDEAKKRGIVTGHARGSAGGCLLSYLLGITSLDPLKWNLSFERFLNEGRLGEPVINFEELPFDEWRKKN